LGSSKLQKWLFYTKQQKITILVSKFNEAGRTRNYAPATGQDYNLKLLSLKKSGTGQQRCICFREICYLLQFQFATAW
jgi:hypothetical protein